MGQTRKVGGEPQEGPARPPPPCRFISPPCCGFSSFPTDPGGRRMAKAGGGHLPTPPPPGLSLSLNSPGAFFTEMEEIIRRGWGVTNISTSRKKERKRSREQQGKGLSSQLKFSQREKIKEKEKRRRCKRAMWGGPGVRGVGAKEMVVGERAGAPPPAPLPNSSPKRQKAELKTQGDAVKSGKGKSYPKRSGGGMWGAAGAGLPPPGLRGAGGRGGTPAGRGLGPGAAPPGAGFSHIPLEQPQIQAELFCSGVAGFSCLVLFWK